MTTLPHLALMTLRSDRQELTIIGMILYRRVLINATGNFLKVEATTKTVVRPQQGRGPWKFLNETCPNFNVLVSRPHTVKLGFLLITWKPYLLKWGLPLTVCYTPTVCATCPRTLITWFMRRMSPLPDRKLLGCTLPGQISGPGTVFNRSPAPPQPVNRLHRCRKVGERKTHPLARGRNPAIRS